MVLLDIINFSAGAYKGYMNASGQDVDPTLLTSTIVGSTIITGLYGLIAHPRAKRLAQGYKPKFVDKVITHSVTNFVLGNIRQYQPQKEPSKIKSIVKRSVGRATMSVLEAGVGYGVGYSIQKLIN